MPEYYPVMLDMRGRAAIVIGGDAVAAEKARGLWESGARVRVISPQFCAELLHLAELGGCTLLPEAYQPGDLAGAFVVIAASTDTRLIRAIEAETRDRGQLLNVVDVPASCSFILPSILRRERLTIAVSTAGASPGLAKRIRQSLEEHFPPAYGAYLRLAAVARSYLRAHGIGYSRRDDFFGDFFVSPVLACLSAGDGTQAAQLTTALLQKYGIDAPADDIEKAFVEEIEHVDRSV